MVALLCPQPAPPPFPPIPPAMMMPVAPVMPMSHGAAAPLSAVPPALGQVPPPPPTSAPPPGPRQIPPPPPQDPPPRVPAPQPLATTSLRSLPSRPAPTSVVQPPAKKVTWSHVYNFWNFRFVVVSQGRGNNKFSQCHIFQLLPRTGHALLDKSQNKLEWKMYVLKSKLELV